MRNSGHPVEEAVPGRTDAAVHEIRIETGVACEMRPQTLEPGMRIAHEGPVDHKAIGASWHHEQFGLTIGGLDTEQPQREACRLQPSRVRPRMAADVLRSFPVADQWLAQVAEIGLELLGEIGVEHGVLFKSFPSLLGEGDHPQDGGGAFPLRQPCGLPPPRDKLGED